MMMMMMMMMVLMIMCRINVKHSYAKEMTSFILHYLKYVDHDFLLLSPPPVYTGRYCPFVFVINVNQQYKRF